MGRLLAPEGCPWDREQTLQTLKRFLVEEAYEVLDAIDEGDPGHHREELGDLLFQIVFQAQLAGHPLPQIILGIGQKLIRRHPHVFGQVQVESSGQVKANWERIKDQERGGRRGILEGVPRSMPALQRAHKLARKAARVGFDWPDLQGVRAKVQEELAELDRAVQQGEAGAVQHEVGDLLMATANWARKLGVDPEQALARANRRFEARFARVEQALQAQGRGPQDCTLDELEALWQQAKGQEAASGDRREPG